MRDGTGVCSPSRPIQPKSTAVHTLSKTPMPVYIDFYACLWYNWKQEQRQHCVAVFYCPAIAGFFIYQKESRMKTPESAVSWHGEVSEKTGDECESLDGQTFYNEDDIHDIPVHSNCRCTITEAEIDARARKCA